MDPLVIHSVIKALVRALERTPGGREWSTLFALASASGLLLVFRRAVRA